MNNLQAQFAGWLEARGFKNTEQDPLVYRKDGGATGQYTAEVDLYDEQVIAVSVYTFDYQEWVAQFSACTPHDIIQNAIEAAERFDK